MSFHKYLILFLFLPERLLFPKAPPPKRPPPWFIAMSSRFLKDINKIDRKLQDRILEALNEITQNPVSLRGDTVKPFSGELEGCWRYRIGATGLSIHPTNRPVTLRSWLLNRGAPSILIKHRAHL